MGEQHKFDFAEPTAIAERTTLAPLPAKLYTPPKLVPRPPSLIEILCRQRSPTEKIADATGMPLKVAQNAAEIVYLYRCLTADQEEELTTETWMRSSWDELVCHVGFVYAAQYAQGETSGCAASGFAARWIEDRKVR